MPVKITGIGSYRPRRVVTNEEVASILRANRDRLLAQGMSLTEEQFNQFETDNDWIVERTGIQERRIAAPEEATSDLAAKAIQNALNVSGLNKKAVDFLLVATVSPDHPFSPPTASVVQGKIGLPTGTAATDISTACSSFIYAFALGYSLIKSGLYKKGIIVGADIMSRTVNWNDRSFSVLIGDGAGAVVLEKGSHGSFVEKPFLLGSDGHHSSLIITEAGGSCKPLTLEALSNPLLQSHKLFMKGPEVFRLMTKMVPDVMDRALAQAGLTISDVDLLIFHQANLRIIDFITNHLKRRAGFKALVYNNIHRYGNTSSASIPLCLTDAWQEGTLQADMTVMAVVFGGGITWGTAIFRWPFLG